MELTKIAVARSQLETACSLYFDDGDPVSIHTLVCASHEILAQLAKENGATSLLRDEFRKDIRPGKEKMFLDMLNKSRNFFKHANQNLPKIHNFNPEENEIIMLDACAMYFKITGEEPFWIWACRGWITLKEPGMFILKEEDRQRIVDLQSICSTKKSFIKTFSNFFQKNKSISKTRTLTSDFLVDDTGFEPVTFRM